MSIFKNLNFILTRGEPLRLSIQNKILYYIFQGSEDKIRSLLGFYIYEDLRDRLGDSSYFGIPRNMDYDGVTAQGKLFRGIYFINYPCILKA